MKFGNYHRDKGGKGLIPKGPILLGGADSAPYCFFHRLQTPQAIKLKLSDFKDTSS